MATAILLIAAIFRLAALHDVPPGLSQDEVLDADIATFIRQGRHAIFFREGYGHEPLYHYWAAPFQALLGDNVLSVRLPAVTLGLLLVAATMRWARRDFGEVAAVVTGVGLAISWWPIIFSRIGLRPILEPLLLVAAAWFWRRRPWLAGVFLGLSLYSYTGARVVFLIPVVLALLQLLVRQPAPARRQQVQAAAIILVVALALYAPLYLTLRADPTLQQRIEQLVGPLEALRQGNAGPALQMTVATVGVFSFRGDPRWTYTLPGRPLFDPLTAILFYGGLLLASARWRRPRYTLILAWLGVTLLPSALTPQAPSTVRLVGAMPVVYLLPGLAVGWVWSRSAGVQGCRGAGVGDLRRFSIPLPRSPVPLLVLVVLFTLNVFLTIRDGFIRWPAAVETRLNHYQTVLLDMGRHWQQAPVERLVVADSFFEPIDADSLRRNLGLNPGARWVQTGTDRAGAVVFPGNGANEANGRFYVPEFAAPPAELLAAAGVPQQPLYRSQSEPSFAVYRLPAAPDVAPMSQPVTFDGIITLLGYNVQPRQEGQPLTLITYWQVEARLPWDLTAFVHLVAADGSIVAQHDGLDAAPATLQPGDSFIQRHVLSLPNTLPDSSRLQLGLYTFHDQRRLTHAGEPADRILLAGESLFDGK
jgi:4-amino-4-deoxy-L-arabinose transferase-like glycosyltransferase